MTILMQTIPNQIATNKLPTSTSKALTLRTQRAIDEGVFPSAAIAVFHKGDLMLDAAWGWADPATRERAVQPEMLFDLASLTKLFTTAAFLPFVTAETVRLQTPLTQVVPEFGRINPRPIDGGQDPFTQERLPVAAEFAGKTADPDAVTFYHLLTHTSGLPAWRAVYAGVPVPPAPDEDDPMPQAQRWQNALAALYDYPFVGVPDGVVRYSDIGLMLLGEAVTRLHGTAGHLAATLQNLVFERLGLERIAYNPLREGYQREQIIPTEDDATWRKRRLWGEVHDENAAGVGGVAGHAGLFADARTVATFGNLWVQGIAAEKLGLDTELWLASTELQVATGAERRGLGWALKTPENSSAGDLFGSKTYGHTGFTGTSLWIDPQAQLVVACLTNRVYPGREGVGIHAYRRDSHNIIADSIRA